MPPLRKDDCPVLSERVGDHHKHIFVSARPRCKECPEQRKYKYTERCGRRHPNYAVCNSCGAKDLTHHYCDYVVWRAMGVGGDHGPCDRRAVEEREYNHEFIETRAWLKRKSFGWLCKQHLPESIQARRDERDAKYRATMQAIDDREAERQSRREALDLLTEVAQWIAKNPELVEEDEWLRTIAEKMAANGYVVKALGVTAND